MSQEIDLDAEWAQLDHIDRMDQYALLGDASGRQPGKAEYSEKYVEQQLRGLSPDPAESNDDHHQEAFDLSEVVVPRCTRKHQYGDDRLQCEDCVDRREAVREAVKLRQAARSEDVIYTVASLGDLDPDKIEIGKRTMGVFGEVKEEDGLSALLADGEVNGIHGQPGCGKTWLGYLILLEQARKEHLSLLIDYELRLPRATQRITELGASAEERGRIAYVSPSHLFGPEEKAKVVSRVAECAAANGLPAETPPEFVLIDSTGNGIGHSGLNQDRDNEVIAWMRLVVKWVQNQWPGVTILLIDHLPKGSDALLPIGSQRKHALAWSQFLVRIREAWSKDESGYSEIICGKDNGGDFTVGKVVARLVGGPDGIRLAERLPEELAAADAEQVLRAREQIEAVVRVETELSLRGMLRAERSDGTKWITVKEKFFRKALGAMITEDQIEIVPVGGSVGNLHRLTVRFLQASVTFDFSGYQQRDWGTRG
jgi:hypothetical protein